MLITSLRALAWTAAMLPALTAATPLTLAQSLDLALQHSQATRGAQAGVASATQAALAAGQLPDPMLRAGVDNLPATGSDRFSTTRDSMTMKRIGISQEWVSSAKRAARQGAAAAAVERESVAVQAAAAQVRLQTALAFFDAYFTGELLKLATLTERHLAEEMEAARARLSSATGNSPDALATAGALGIAEDESAELRQRQSAAFAALERWLGLHATELAAPVELPAADEQAFVANHPTVAAAQRDTESARQEAAVAASNRKPNWSWELSYGQRSGYSDMVSFGVSIPLPVSPAQRQDRDTASKQALVDRAENMLAEATRAAQAEFRGLSSDAQRLTDRLQRYESSVLLPTRQRTAAILAGYRSNQTPLVQLFEARHREVEAQRRMLLLQRDFATARAQLAYKPLLQGGAR